MIVVGTGSKEYVSELKRYSCSIGINKHVIFTGFLKSTDKIIASLDVLVASSLVDAFGRSIVEAMLQRTPVIASKCGGHVDIVNDKVNGVFYEPAIKGDFFDKISMMMKGVDVDVDALSDNAYQFSKTKFSSQEHLVSVLFIYRNLFKS